MGMFSTGCGDSGGENNYTPITQSFKGMGFEWDMYDNMNNWNSAVYEYAKQAANGINPSSVRIMFDIDKYCVSFGATNTPVYDFETDSMKNLYDILDYCEAKGIKVAIGVWHARYEGSYVFDAVKDEGTELFAKVVTDMLAELINVKGYTCIKYLVPYNEPNYTRRYRNGALVNPYKLWTYCMNNLKAEFEKRTFASKVEIAGPDMSTLTESGTWLSEAEKEFSQDLGIYEMHVYPSSYLVKTGGLSDRLTSIIGRLKNNDRDIWLYESGISDGITSSGQSNITAYGYGLQTVDLALQSVIAGIDGVMFWSFDKKMHQSGGVDSDFGLIDSQKKELRPWYYSTLMLSNALTENSKVYLVKNDGVVRSVAAENESGVYLLTVNRGEEDVSFDINYENGFDKGELYSYVFDAENLICDNDGNILPAEFIKGKLSAGITYTVPAGSFAVLCTEKY